MNNKPHIPAYKEALPVALLRAKEVVMNAFRPMLATHGVTEPQWRVIRAVQDQEGITATTLSERCCILMPSLSRMLKSLEKKDYVHRQGVHGDRRRSTVALTKKGTELFNAHCSKSRSNLRRN